MEENRMIPYDGLHVYKYLWTTGEKTTCTEISAEARYLCNRKFQNNDYSELYFFVVQLTIISVSVSVMCHSLLIY